MGIGKSGSRVSADTWLVTPLHTYRGDEHSPVDMFLRMRRQRVHGHSSERPGMHDNAEAEQNSLAQAEERTRCAGLLRR